MRLFKKNRSPTNHPVRSAEQLVPAAPHPDDRRYSQFEYQPAQPVQSIQTQTQTQTPQSSQSPSLSRSQSQRQNSARDRPTVNIVDERRDKSTSARPSSSLIERSVSFRGKTISNPISQPASPRVSHPETVNETDEFPPQLQHSYSENPSPVTAPQSVEPRSASLAYQQQQQYTQRGPPPSHPAHTQDSERSQLKVNPPLHTQPPSRATDPEHARSPTEIPESPYAETHRGLTQDPVLNTRPLSRTHEPLSPVHSRPDTMQSQGQAFQSDKQSAGSPQQDRSRRGSVSNMPENGRGTPTTTHRREESGEVDVRALIQKHDELRKTT